MSYRFEIFDDGRSVPSYENRDRYDCNESGDRRHSSVMPYPRESVDYASSVLNELHVPMTSRGRSMTATIYSGHMADEIRGSIQNEMRKSRAQSGRHSVSPTSRVTITRQTPRSSSSFRGSVSRVCYDAYGGSPKTTVTTIYPEIPANWTKSEASPPLENDISLCICPPGGSTANYGYRDSNGGYTIELESEPNTRKSSVSIITPANNQFDVSQRNSITRRRSVERLNGRHSRIDIRYAKPAGHNIRSSADSVVISNNDGNEIYVVPNERSIRYSVDGRPSTNVRKISIVPGDRNTSVITYLSPRSAFGRTSYVKTSIPNDGRPPVTRFSVQRDIY